MNTASRLKMVGVAAVLSIVCWNQAAVHGFSIWKYQTHVRVNQHSLRDIGYPRRYLTATSRSTPSPEINRKQPENEQIAIPGGESYSTLTLLEHMHLLTPNVHHGTSNGSKSIIDLFVNTMGFGLDPKSVDSINKESGVTFVNCGASQLHLNDDSNYCQQMEKLQNEMQESNSDNTLAAYEVGLRYNNLPLLKEELSKAGNLCSYEIIDEGSDRETIRITDAYGRIFVARESKKVDSDANSEEEPTISSICQQKVIRSSEEDISQYGPKMVDQYGTDSTPFCQGIDYIEFLVPVHHKNDNGKTMEKIAKFYDFFFDAITTVAYDGTSHIAIIGFGNVDSNGRAEQSLLFREMLCDNPPVAGGVVNDDNIGTGHHIAIYVGANDDDYEAAATNCMDGGILWVNTLFEDRVLDVDSAMEVKQFRFKDIIDIETGDVLYALEHEIRSVSHHLFPGTK